MKITALTNPATLMFADRPDIEITGLRDRPRNHWAELHVPEFYVNYIDGGKREQTAANERGKETGWAKFGGIVERNTFRLTADTDPATIMFEGHPDITIVRISERPREFWNGKMAEFYVLSRLDGVQQAGVAYHEDGTFSEGMTAKHRQHIVPRATAPTIDWHKPVFSSHYCTYNETFYEVRVDSLVTPVDPDAAPYVNLALRRVDLKDWGMLCKFTLDGKALGQPGQSHSGKLSNVDQRERVVGEVTNSGVGVNVTYRGDVPIKVELP